MNTIKVYINSATCSQCHKMLAYLDVIGEEYTAYDLSEADKDIRQGYKKELFALFDEKEEKYIPVVLIDDNKKIVGYGAEQIDKINEYLSKR